MEARAESQVVAVHQVVVGARAPLDARQCLSAGAAAEARRVVDLAARPLRLGREDVEAAEPAARRRARGPHRAELLGRRRPGALRRRRWRGLFLEHGAPLGDGRAALAAGRRRFRRWRRRFGRLLDHAHALRDEQRRAAAELDVAIVRRLRRRRRTAPAASSEDVGEPGAAAPALRHVLPVARAAHAAPAAAPAPRVFDRASNYGTRRPRTVPSARRTAARTARARAPAPRRWTARRSSCRRGARRRRASRRRRRGARRRPASRRRRRAAARCRAPPPARRRRRRRRRRAPEPPGCRRTRAAPAPPSSRDAVSQTGSPSLGRLASQRGSPSPGWPARPRRLTSMTKW